MMYSLKTVTKIVFSILYEPMILLKNVKHKQYYSLSSKNNANTKISCYLYYYSDDKNNSKNPTFLAVIYNKQTIDFFGAESA
jgi:hypothetical protein